MSRADKKDEKIKALRIEALALEAQEAERGFQEVNNRINLSHTQSQKRARNGKLRFDSHDQDRLGSQNRDGQRLMDQGQDDDFEDFPSDDPRERAKILTNKQSDRATDGGDSHPLFSSNIELFLSRIAQAQEDIVLVTKHQELKTTTKPVTRLGAIFADT